ncbi:response regulator [Anabaena cylindrica FACHB-243]|uniref:Response regulator receiver modulated diguanylate cyclase n=1 Tax=Anabaena cylindrica (strain ATCC 27899 / PCC 7122) TaxID=272123 RepID=K9ZMA2_ANACC|nr:MULTISPECIES: response regulator [Anabaena]AFZ59919.1 response regulator receiver modulated diguanylate cyclase [Anabaena cylindrica PCC 7122]MBD2416750.1 response regulator [Anabaena cylindrica FACHB-243]MBY5284595.1 response regulator [Anabaena sp. CCAP 1446/1C]MBY5311811.1 response regulator [Anabaena sp. CCAP 1446/1C]MCM2409830.1 response regulator [Anabaena sp. CCAP 1446/1C]
MKILCVEDDRNIGNLLQITLAKQRYQIELAQDGQAGWDLAEVYTYDLILLDVMLPKLDGISFCKKLRSNQSSALNPNRDTPVILMTALDAVTNKVMGLDAGADDYLAKPFNIDELLARIRALLRRNQIQKTPLLTWGDLWLNPNSCEVTFQEKPIYLAAKEYEILELFLRYPEQIFNPSRLLDRLWTADEFPSEGAVRTHIKGLRQKLKQAGVADILETIYKQGYRLKPQKVISKDGQEDITSAPIPAAGVALELKAVWEKYRQSYSDRISIIEQAVTASQNGTLTPIQQHEAEQEAHTLIGSLGCFGLDAASQISRQIQQLFQREQGLKPPEIKQLEQLLTQLQQEITQYGFEAQEEFLPLTPTIPSHPIAFSDISFGKQGEKDISLENNLVSPSLLIVDDDFLLANQIAIEATNWGFQAEIAVNLQQAQEFLTHHFDVILLDINFLDSTKNGLGFLTAVRNQYPEIPVVMLTAEDSFAQRVEAARLGSQCFLQKPIAPNQVLATVTQVIQQKNQPVARLLIVDDDLGLLNLLRTLLEPCGYHLTLLDQPHKFWETLEQTVPDLLILDVEFSVVSLSHQHKEQGTVSFWSGFDLCQVVRSDIRWNRLPVLFLSSHTDIDTMQRSFAVGADDFLTKPIVATELLTRVRTRLEQRQLWRVAEIDALTGLSLRRKVLQDLTRLLQLAQRQQQPLSLAMLDLDNFKLVNDQYGHEMGDRVLNYFGKLLNQSFRQEDIVGRWGGEEFVVGMYGTSKEEGMRRLAQVLQQFSQHSFTAQQKGGDKKDETKFQVTFSGGIAQTPDNGKDLQTLYQKADIALYQAKALGRNRICLAILNS